MLEDGGSGQAKSEAWKLLGHDIKTPVDLGKLVIQRGAAAVLDTTDDNRSIEVQSDERFDDLGRK